MPETFPNGIRQTQSNGEVILRLLKLTWRYRGGCLCSITLQVIILLLGIAALRFSGEAIDIMRVSVASFHHRQSEASHWMIDDGTHPLREISILSAMTLAFALLRACLSYLYAVQVNKVVEQSFTVDLRSTVYEHLQQLSFRFFDANTSGSIVARLTSDVQLARMFVDQVVLQTLTVFISVSVYVVYMARLSWPLAAACLGSTPLLFILATSFSRHIQPEYSKNRSLADALLHVATENIRGFSILKGFGREENARLRFETANRRVSEQQQRIFWKVSLFTPCAWFLTRINTIVLLVFGGWLVVSKDFPIGSGLIVFAGLLELFAAQVNNVSAIANSAQQSLIGARRVFDILDTPLGVKNAPNALRCSRLHGCIRYEAVCFEYGEADAVLRDIDLEVTPGQRVAILGSTGAGKSIMMGLLPRFYDVSRGRVLIDGIDVRNIDLDDLRSNIGTVFQESFLFSNTIAENIAFGVPEATSAEIETAARVAVAHEFIIGLPNGYDTILGEGGSGLSGGQKQRLAIARAILKQPSILLLDDPTASMDGETENEIHLALDQATRGRTTFIVAHRISTLQRADLIVVMEKGRIVQRGTHDELMRVPGPYLNVAKAQLVHDPDVISIGRERAIQ